ncbi:MAG TPA: hypothetical protein VEA40_17810 [Ramlibacter sp.]|nr:hypothetical protein [Ramlibacter sp.]
MRVPIPVLPALLAGALVLPAAGQSTPAAQPLPFTSALDGYRRHAEQEVAPWKASNDTVGRIGGWKAYAREAAAPAPQRPASAPAPQGGHRHH